MKPYKRTTWRGVRVDGRTLSALEWVDQRFHDETGKRVELAQGSYNAGGVSASAGTHDGGGVVDCRTVPLTKEQRTRLVHLLKRAGFAAWYRPAAPGVWGEHVHACLIGTKPGTYHRTMSAGARRQVDAFLAGRDGLAGNRRDNTYRVKPQVRWSHKRRKPVRYR